MDELNIQIDRTTRFRTSGVAADTFTLSRMWLGKALGALGKENPYPQSRDPHSPVIEKSADKMDEPRYLEYPEFTTMTEVVKQLRQHISTLSEEINTITLALHERIAPTVYTGILYDAMNHAYKYCIETGMWLGMTLNAIDCYRNPQPTNSESRTLNIF